MKGKLLSPIPPLVDYHVLCAMCCYTEYFRALSPVDAAHYIHRVGWRRIAYGPRYLDWLCPDCTHRHPSHLVA